MGQKARKQLEEKVLQQHEKINYIDEQINFSERRINDIERSNTWKMTSMIRKLKEFFARLFLPSDRREDYETIERLQARLIETEKALETLKRTELTNRINERPISETEINDQLRTLKNKGELIETIDTIGKQKQQINDQLHQALTYAARLYMNNDNDERNLIYEKILPYLHNEEIPEFMIRSGITEPSIPLQQVASFRGSLNIRMRQKQLNGTLQEWPLDDKRLAYDFAKHLGLTIPHIDETSYTFNTIPYKEGTVIKPVDGAGSRGVYLVHSDEDIYDVRRSKNLNNWEQLMTQLKEDLQTEAVTEDNWLIEQLIYENKNKKTPARDLKFYCFYGKVGIILEIIRDPEVRHCWWTADGKRISTEKYDETLFKGIGVTEEELLLAEQISAEIPSPFIRIDFLKGEDGLVLGEFTPKPGSYDEFDETTDKWLGDYFIDAQGRLVNDLLNGKQFTKYEQFFQNVQTSSEITDDAT